MNANQAAGFDRQKGSRDTVAVIHCVTQTERGVVRRTLTTRRLILAGRESSINFSTLLHSVTWCSFDRFLCISSRQKCYAVTVRERRSILD